MAGQAIYLVDFLTGGRNFISLVYLPATSPLKRLLREKSGESGYMPRNFCGGTIPMLSPRAENWGDASPPPARPRSVVGRTPT